MIQACRSQIDFFFPPTLKMLFTSFYKLEISTPATNLEALGQIPRVESSIQKRRTNNVFKSIWDLGGLPGTRITPDKLHEAALVAHGAAGEH